MSNTAGVLAHRIFNRWKKTNPLGFEGKNYNPVNVFLSPDTGLAQQDIAIK